MAPGLDPNLWPGSSRGAAAVPVRVGINRKTGQLLIGWPHVEQSILVLFETRFHERILRQWEGSFVPHLLGRNAVESVITRFFWAMATGIDLWEPCYRVRRVHIARTDGSTFEQTEVLTSVDTLRRGEASFQILGDYMPRGHLGDKTVESRRTIGLLGAGEGRWSIMA
jgi:phage baseplate assembly protein W